MTGPRDSTEDSATTSPTPDLKRRHFLGGMATAGVGLRSLPARPTACVAPAPWRAARWTAPCRKSIKTVVVIYGENRSFNNLFANFPGPEKPLSALKPADFAQRDRAVKLLRTSPQWDTMVVIVTVDENGGWWDHVAPPKGDCWSPGTRLPALVISPFARQGTVDHTIYDTGSILRLITRVFGLEQLDGLQQRDAAMRARGQQPMGDWTNALQFKS